MSNVKSEAAQVAAIIRKELKANGINATVRSRNFSMGNSVDVTLTDELPATVAKVESFCSAYKAGSFDGMTDCYNYDNRNNGPTAKFISVTASYSDDVRQAAWDYVRANIEGAQDAPQDVQQAGMHFIKRFDLFGDQMVWRILNGSEGVFWYPRKRRVSAA